MVKNCYHSQDYIPNHGLTLRQHYDNDVSTGFKHFDLKIEFYGENKNLSDSKVKMMIFESYVIFVTLKIQ